MGPYRAKRRKLMTQYLVRMLKERGELGRFLEHEPPTRTGRAIHKLLMDGAIKESGK